MGWLSEPLHYAFMQTGLLAVVLVGVTCATLGVYVVLRRLAFIGWAPRHQMLGEDTAIGILFTGMFALGILLSSMSRSFRDLSHLLFGNILGVTPGDLALIAGVTVVVPSALIMLHKELVLTSLDPLYAVSIGLRADLVHDGLLLLLALTVVIGIQATGVVLTNALLIIPAASAALLTDRLPGMMLLAAGIAVVSSVVGLYGSYYWHVSSGAAIVLTCTAYFGGAWGIRQWRQRKWMPSSCSRP